MTLDLFPEARVDPTVDLDRRYTTRETMALCMKLAGVEEWDLDVAADEESHWAPRWYDVRADGLSQPWKGPRIWCNPPYSNLEPWLRRVWEAFTTEWFDIDVVAMLLPASRTEQPWWQDLVEPYRDRGVLDGASRRSWEGEATPRVLGGDIELTSHFLPGRIKFGHPGNRDAVGVGSPPFGCVLLVWRRA